MLGQAAVARPGQRGVRTATASREHGGAAAVDLVGALDLDLLLLLGELGLGLDVDPPAGQLGRQPGVLSLAPDRQRELVVGDDDGRLLVRVVDEDLAHAGRRQRLGDEPGGLLVVGNDVDLLAAQLGNDHAHPRAPGADAGADRVDPVGVGDDGDLGAVAGLAGDPDDLDQVVGDLGDLELEQRLDQLGAAARDDDARALALGGDVCDHGLDPHPVVVALVPDLLRARQQRLDALAQLDQRVAVVRLLDDAVDQLADAVLVLVEHHLALGLADALQDHLLGGLRGDPPEVLGGDVAGLDLVLVGSQHLRIELGVLRFAQLARLRVDLLLLLLGRLVEQLLLQFGRQDQLEDAEVRGIAVEVDARVLGGAGGLLVRGEQGILERLHQRLGIDPLLLLQPPDRLYDLATHASPPESSGTRFERRMPVSGMVTSRAPSSTETLASSAALSVPVKLR